MIPFPLKRGISISTIFSRDGFSLLELVAVLFIISIMAGLVVASFTSTGTELEQQAQKFATIIRTVDDIVAARKQSMELQFDFDTKIIKWPGSDGKKGSAQDAKFSMLAGVESVSLGLVKEDQLTLTLEPSRTTESLLVYFQDKDKRITVKYNPFGRRTKIIGPEDI